MYKMIKIFFQCSFLILALSFFSCKEELKQEPLNIAEYLTHIDGDKIYPSAKQIEMLKMNNKDLTKKKKKKRKKKKKKLEKI